MQVEALVLLEYAHGVLVVELAADGTAMDDSWFETTDEALGVFDDASWENLPAS